MIFCQCTANNVGRKKEMISVNHQLKNARIEKGLSMAELSRQADVSKSYYSMIENGHREPSGRIAVRLAQILGVPLETFYLSA